MLFLSPQHIVDVYVWVDSHLPQTETVGRPLIMNDAEIVTILIWCTCTLKQKTWKDCYDTVRLYHQDDFNIPSYKTFVRRVQAVLPQMVRLLDQLLCHTEPVRLVDATMLPVSKPHRADRHSVAKDIAQFGKNWQGWHYGFKLHASTTLDGTLCSFRFSGANIYDAQMLPHLLNEHCAVAVGDTLYGASVMRKIMHDKYGTCIITPPWPTQKKKLATLKQLDFLNQRSKIECVFDYLKEHLHLVSSFPRSVTGYFVQYVRVLLGYQIMALAKDLPAPLN